MKRHTHIDVSYLCDAMVSANWKRHKPDENKHWCKRLWTPALFGEHEYKGSATQCHALMALMRWYCETLWIHIPCLRAIAECFLALARCTDALRQGKKTHDWSDLDKAQSDHHKLFATVHPGLMRPKHHHRLHLSNHYRKHHVSINCWGIEQSHQNYKTIYADNLQQFLRADNGGKGIQPAAHATPAASFAAAVPRTSVRERRFHTGFSVCNGRSRSQYWITRHANQSQLPPATRDSPRELNSSLGEKL